LSALDSSPHTRTEPWLLGAAAVAHATNTDATNGLTSAQAAVRLQRDGHNELEAAEEVPGWKAFLRQFADPLVYLLLAAVVISFVAWLLEGRKAARFDVIVIVTIVILNAALGFAQESRAEHAVAALQRMAATNAHVIRDGVETQVASADLVVGDVVVLGEGDAVSADARLIEVASLAVAEAALTGESVSVFKSTDTIHGPAGIGDRVNMVFNGTAVSQGRGRAIVTAVGMATEMGTVARLLGDTEEQRTPLQRQVDRIGRMLGIAVVIIAVIVTTAVYFTTDIKDATDVVEVLLIGVSLAVAAVPEGLPAILSVVLALGVQRMARQNAIVKKLSSVETLGSASVICSDKTGTLTKNEMTIEKVVTPSGEVDITGSGYRPVGEVHVDGQPTNDQALLDEVHRVLRGGSLANNASLQQDGETWTIQGDPTEAAFLVAEAKVGMTDARKARFQRVGEIAFTSERKLMTTMHTDAERDGHISIVTKGAPDVLLTRCTHERIAGDVRLLTDERRAELLATIDRLADLALRTLAVAYRRIDRATPPIENESTERDLIYLGMVGIIDPPRPEAKIAIAAARAAGVRIIMITGDHPRTATRIARDLGIVGADARALSGVEIEALDEAELRAEAQIVSAFARVSPEHKLRIVSALRAEQNIVAMTGDGVNDAPALKMADIGVAMGIGGTDVTKQAADMILADDNFATIVIAIREGRAIFANIRRFLRFLLSSNVGEVFTMFFGVMLAGPLGLDASGGTIAVPLLATQLLWVNLMTDSAPALAMGVDPAPDDIMERPPRHMNDAIIDARMWIGIVWVGLITAGVTLAALDMRLPGGFLGESSGNIVEARTMALTTLVFAQMFNVFNARSDKVSAFHRLFTNRLLWAAVALSIVLQVAVVNIPFLNRAFATTPLTSLDWLICVGLASIVLWADEAKKLVLAFVSR
jgi:P-type Ca2+ transporter type 2C